MKRSPRALPASARVFRMGGTYRIKAGGLQVIAEDQEISGGHRTGRILVRADDPRSRVPVRWLCEPSDLEEVRSAPPATPVAEGTHS